MKWSTVNGRKDKKVETEVIGSHTGTSPAARVLNASVSSEVSVADLLESVKAEILAESEEGAAPFKTGTIKDGAPGGDTPSDITLFQNMMNVKQRDIGYPLDGIGVAMYDLYDHEYPLYIRE